ncbi:hypothetical protein ACFZAR_39115 [Streptomyces sp. NPDC008222]|uniref:hypothetical protein n=1 Tax=Streptomyces sp. NPDC008222 TaxID=3364820 RepID=UPI0036ECB119
MELARAEIQPCARNERNSKAALQCNLGQQLDQFAAKDLVARIDELTRHNQELSAQLRQKRQDNHAVPQRLQEGEDDLTAARISLRRMIREESRSDR